MEHLNRIKIILVQQDMTSKELAEKLGCSVSTIAKWRSNSNQPDIATLKKICDALGLKSSDVLTF